MIHKNVNKSAQSNLGRGPRRCESLQHVRRKVSIGYNGAPQIRPPKVPLPWTDPQTPLFRPWTRPTYDAKRHPDPNRRFSTMHWTERRTDRSTHRPTDRPRESLITIGRYASRATRPNNYCMMFLWEYILLA